jgi:hypothetical protein
MIEQQPTAATLEHLRALELISGGEVDTVMGIFEPEFAFGEALSAAESVHVHIKVDETDAPHRDQFRALGGSVESSKDGYIKYTFDGGVNVILSSIDVSEDDLAETPCSRRARPFVDHIGIDMRRETADVQSQFEALPRQATAIGWSHVPQGAPGKPVFCCHVEVGRKHWIYPAGDSCAPGIPLEFALGRLKINAESSGCDLRPARPGTAASGAAEKCDAHE